MFSITFENVKKIHASIENRSDILERRILSLQPTPMVKKAFDTRRINQETDFNPRRNLQYYHRSDPYLNKNAEESIKIFFKLKTAVDSIKEDFLGDPDWLDSYARVLSNALDRTLRVEQKDMDFFQPQLDYLNELLYLRYRLRPEDINKLGELELRNSILDRDEKLMHKQIFAHYDKSPIIKTNMMELAANIKSQDQLIDKLFGDVKVSHNNPQVKRSINITIEDQIMGARDGK